MTVVPFPKRMWVSDPQTIEFLRHYRASSPRRKIAIANYLERVVTNTVDEAESARLFRLESEELDSRAVAAVRRESLKVVFADGDPKPKTAIHLAHDGCADPEPAA
jgi:hypothetical protein